MMEAPTRFLFIPIKKLELGMFLEFSRNYAFPYPIKGFLATQTTLAIVFFCHGLWALWCSDQMS